MILILGGGLAGLATAYHLRRLLPGVPRLVLEKEPVPGGLSRSRRVDGFTFDFTGHYLHLRDAETTAFVEELTGGRMMQVERRAFICSRGARLDFPYQANLHGLPPELVAKMLLDFVEAAKTPLPARPEELPFGEWARRVFGDGIAEGFMIPYNTKLFGCAPDELTAEWVSWAVPRPDLAQVVHGALGLKNAGMGYNPRFRYPQEGGIGILAEALAERVGDDLRCGASVVSIDARERRVVLQGGEVLPFEAVVSTLPLPYLLQRVRGIDGCPGLGMTLAEMAGALRWSAVIDLELGIDRPGVADGAHWIYFPDPELPFYRVGFPSNVARSLAPAGCSSLSVEFFHRPGTPLPPTESLVAQTRAGLEATGVLRPADRIVCAEAALLDPAYVLFDARRTPTVEAAMRRLNGAGIRSIGRFGAWTYSYMERALLDGRDAAAAIAAERLA
jgi:protoporphyrinogen oxidase